MGLFRGAYGKVLFSALGFALAPTLARADFFVHPWENFRNEEKRPHLIASGRMLSTSGNYDGFGSPVAPTGLTGYLRIEADGLIAHAFNSRLTGFARLAWGLVSRSRTAGKDSSFGLTDQSVGLNYRVFPLPHFGPNPPPPALTLDLQLQVDIPGYSSQPANNLPPLGDASLNAIAGGFLTLPIGGFSSGSLRARAGAAYAYRTSGFAGLLPWSAWLEYDPDAQGGQKLDPNGHLLRESGLLAALGAYGVFPLSQSTASQLLAATQSLATGSVDPQLLVASGKLGYRFQSGMAFTANGGATVIGQVAPKGFVAWLTVDLPLGQGGRTAPDKDPVLIAPKVYGAANRGFVNYSIEGRVMRVSDRRGQIRIDRGSQDGVEVGQVFDIFVTKPDGTTGEGVARCKVSSVKPEESTLSIVEYFREIWIDEGFVARRLIQ
jgi:hypothetical protein